ncbi:MAG: hypothetical protein IPH45_15985 [Bacteroidales bacterium]|nr:hypothetical protein [Bacteroidales bacterium]
MNQTTESRSSLPGLSNLVHTIAELYQDGVQDTYAPGRTNWDPFLERLLLEAQGVVYVPGTGIPCKLNPFDGTLVLYDRTLSRLKILLSLPKPLRVVGELYRTDGVFIKRLFDREIGKGASEIVGIGCKRRRGEFMLMLNSPEGMRSFRIKKEE